MAEPKLITGRVWEVNPPAKALVEALELSGMTRILAIGWCIRISVTLGGDAKEYAEEREILAQLLEKGGM